MTDLVSLCVLGLAALPAVLALVNVRHLRPPDRSRMPEDRSFLSILIPARNEEANIDAALTAALASTGVDFEVIVLDDGSVDRTAEIVRQRAGRDARVRLERAPPLPQGWSGKVHACQCLADRANGTHFLFLDADVRLSRHAAADLLSHARSTGAALVSGVPRQEMRSLGELLTVPAINLLLIGYLPIPLMRKSCDPALGAACGQLLLVERSAYRSVGGHAAIRNCVHDAMQLVRCFRRAGHRTDLIDGSGLAECRMYSGLREAWAGFAKNATEGMARPVALPVWTVLLGGGHVLPPVLVGLALLGHAPLGVALAALALSMGSRLVVTVKTRESGWTVPLHPATVATALAIQWTALVRAGRGRPFEWKGRVLSAE